MRRFSSGYSVLEILVVTAIGGVIAVMIMAIIDNMTQVMVRGNVVESLEGTFRTVSGVLTNTRLCSNSLRGPGGPGDKLTWDPDSVPELTISEIYSQESDNTPGAAPILSAVPGNSLSRIYGGVSVTSIKLREKTPGVGRGTLRQNGIVYTTIAAEIEIMVSAPGGAIAGGVVRRVIPYTALVNPVGGAIDGCYVRDNAVQTLCNSMGGTYNNLSGNCKELINPTKVECDQVCNDPTQTGNYLSNGGRCVQNCPPGAGTPGSKCIRLDHLLGFEYVAPATQNDPATSRPLCACTRVCFNNVPGSGPRGSPPSTVTPPPPPPPRPPRPPPPPRRGN